MRKYNILLGFVGGVLSMAIAPGLMCGGFYVLGCISFLVGLAIIDYNRGGN